jgi:hypothetical protein
MEKYEKIEIVDLQGMSYETYYITKQLKGGLKNE